MTSGMQNKPATKAIDGSFLLMFRKAVDKNFIYFSLTSSSHYGRRMTVVKLFSKITCKTCLHYLCCLRLSNMCKTYVEVLVAIPVNLVLEKSISLFVKVARTLAASELHRPLVTSSEKKIRFWTLTKQAAYRTLPEYEAILANCTFYANNLETLY